jgi:hypothetical protein
MTHLLLIATNQGYTSHCVASWTAWDDTYVLIKHCVTCGNSKAPWGPFILPYNTHHLTCCFCSNNLPTDSASYCKPNNTSRLTPLMCDQSWSWIVITSLGTYTLGSKLEEPLSD